MTAAASLLLVLAPWVPLEPVGRGDWESDADPVVRRWSSLLAGAPVRVGSMTVVPLFARVPGEAGTPGAGAAWPERLGVTAVFERQRLYLRLENTKDRPVLVAAGTGFENGRSEAFTERDVIVPPRFAVLVPAAANTRLPPPPDGTRLSEGALLPANAAAALLHPQGALQPAAWNLHGGATRYAGAVRSPAVVHATRSLIARCRPLEGERAGTAVGCVLLVGNWPQAAHVFASHELFVDALPDLLQGLAVRAVEERFHGGGEGPLARLAEWGDPVGRSLAFVRTLLQAPSERAESYGEGFETLQTSNRDRAVGHAVLDLRGTVVHACFLAMEGAWPGHVGGPNRPPTPQPPTGGTPETAPGVVDRKPRPSIAEARQRERRPRR